MRARIVNDSGVAHNTRVFDANGKDVTADLRVCGVQLEIGSGGDVVSGTLELVAPSIDIVGDFDVRHVCPHCGHVSEEGE